MLAGRLIINTFDSASQSIRRAGFLAGREFGSGVLANAGTRAFMQR